VSGETQFRFIEDEVAELVEQCSGEVV